MRYEAKRTGGPISATRQAAASGRRVIRAPSFRLGLRQLVVAVAEPLQAQRKTNAFLRGLKDEKRRGLPGAQLADKGVVHDDLGVAAARQTAHKARPAHIRIIDLQSEPRRQQYAERRLNPH